MSNYKALVKDMIKAGEDKEKESKDAIVRTDQGKFESGTTGNPRGRPPGVLNRPNQLKQYMSDEKAYDVIDQLYRVIMKESTADSVKVLAAKEWLQYVLPGKEKSGRSITITEENGGLTSIGIVTLPPRVELNDDKNDGENDEND